MSVYQPVLIMWCLGWFRIFRDVGKTVSVTELNAARSVSAILFVAFPACIQIALSHNTLCSCSAQDKMAQVLRAGKHKMIDNSELLFMLHTYNIHFAMLF